MVPLRQRVIQHVLARRQDRRLLLVLHQQLLEPVRPLPVEPTVPRTLRPHPVGGRSSVLRAAATRARRPPQTRGGRGSRGRRSQAGDHRIRRAATSRQRTYQQTTPVHFGHRGHLSGHVIPSRASLSPRPDWTSNIASTAPPTSQPSPISIYAAPIHCPTILT